MQRCAKEVFCGTLSLPFSCSTLTHVADHVVVVKSTHVSSLRVDPFHSNCQRIISVDGRKASLQGTDGDPGCPADGSGTKWTLTGKIEGIHTILVDFTPKGGPKDLRGEFDGNGIRWPIGKSSSSSCTLSCVRDIEFARRRLY